MGRIPWLSGFKLRNFVTSAETYATEMFRTRFLCSNQSSSNTSSSRKSSESELPALRGAEASRAVEATDWHGGGGSRERAFRIRELLGVERSRKKPSVNRPDVGVIGVWKLSGVCADSNYQISNPWSRNECLSS